MSIRQKLNWFEKKKGGGGRRLTAGSPPFDVSSSARYSHHGVGVDLTGEKCTAEERDDNRPHDIKNVRAKKKYILKMWMKMCV